MKLVLTDMLSILSVWSGSLALLIRTDSEGLRCNSVLQCLAYRRPVVNFWRLVWGQHQPKHPSCEEERWRCQVEGQWGSGMLQLSTHQPERNKEQEVSLTVKLWSYSNWKLWIPVSTICSGTASLLCHCFSKKNQIFIPSPLLWNPFPTGTTTGSQLMLGMLEVGVAMFYHEVHVKLRLA